MRRLSLPLCLVLLACNDPGVKKRAAEAQAKAAKAKAEMKDQVAQANKPPPPPEPVKLSPPWDEAAHTILVPDGKCPEGLWALFNLGAPGETPAEKKANLARKAALEKELREKTFLVKFGRGEQVKLLPHDAPKGVMPIDVLGSIDCTDSAGHITIAWTDAKAEAPSASAAQEGSEIQQNIWNAPPVAFRLPMPSMAEAKKFTDEHKIGLSARVVFKLGKVANDKKLFKPGKVVAGDISIGGSTEDWGAGRLVRAELIGVRVAADREKTSIAEKLGNAK